jgi:DNA primase
VRFVFLPDGHDPDSFVNEKGTDAFMSLLDDGMALSDFLIHELASQVDMETVDGRARLAELARPLLQRIPTGVYRELLVESLAETVGLTAAKLEKMLAGDRSPAGDKRGPVTQATARRGVPRGAGQPSLVRRAISLLLNHPPAAAELDPGRLQGIDKPGAELLMALIETVQGEPNISTAGLLERWRHDEDGRHLGKLAATELPEDDEFDAAAELAECLEQLVATGRRERVAFLIEKQKGGELGDREKQELHQLLGRAG